MLRFIVVMPQFGYVAFKFLVEQVKKKKTKQNKKKKKKYDDSLASPASCVIIEE